MEEKEPILDWTLCNIVQSKEKAEEDKKNNSSEEKSMSAVYKIDENTQSYKHFW